MLAELPSTGNGAAAVCRNYRITDLVADGDKYGVVILVKGDASPINTGETVQEYAPYASTAEGGVFDYLTDHERRVLRRGVVKRGDDYFDKNPATGGKRGD